MPWLLQRSGRMHFQLAERTAKRHLLRRGESLTGETDHTVIGQCAQRITQRVAAERLAQVQALDPAAQCFTRWFDAPHRHPPLWSVNRNTGLRDGLLVTEDKR